MGQWNTVEYGIGQWNKKGDMKRCRLVWGYKLNAVVFGAIIYYSHILFRCNKREKIVSSHTKWFGTFRENLRLLFFSLHSVQYTKQKSDEKWFPRSSTILKANRRTKMGEAWEQSYFWVTCWSSCSQCEEDGCLDDQSLESPSQWSFTGKSTVRYDINNWSRINCIIPCTIMTFSQQQSNIVPLFLTACEQCMKAADVYCMECRNNYCRRCSNIRHGHKSRAYHSVRRLEDLDTEDEEKVTNSQTGMLS